MNRRAGTGFIAGLEREDRTRYYEWWSKYVWLGRAGWISFLALAACILGRNSLLSPVAYAAAKPLLGVFVVLLLWRALLDCPRCGQRFQGWYGGDHDYFDGECQNCGLTKREISSIAKPR